MTTPPFPTVVPPPPDARLLAVTRTAAAASLAGGIIAASGRPFSLEEALAVLADVQFSLFAEPGHGRYDDWKRNHDVTKVYK